MAVLVAPVVLAGLSCRSPAEVVTEAVEAAQVEPYVGYFQALRPEGVYLFANLPEKQAFDRGSGELRFREYVTRTGLRVLIHSPIAGDPADVSADEVERGAPDEAIGATGDRVRPPPTVVEAIARGYEQTEGTVLTLLSDPDAPPVAPVRPEVDADTEPEPTTAPTTGPGNVDSQQ